MTPTPDQALPQDAELVTASVCLVWELLAVYRMSDREPAYAVASVDKMLEKLGGGEDIMGAMRAEPRKLKSGEHKLALEMLELALKDASKPPTTKKKMLNREEARAWLRDDAAIFSARVCFEALGMDYEAALEKLEQQWSANT